MVNNRSLKILENVWPEKRKRKQNSPRAQFSCYCSRMSNFLQIEQFFLFKLKNRSWANYNTPLPTVSTCSASDLTSLATKLVTKLPATFLPQTEMQPGKAIR